MVRLEIRKIVVISIGSLMVLSLFTMFSEQAFAELTTVDHIDSGGICDELKVPAIVHELGNQPPFPNEEWITSSHITTAEIACPSRNSALVGNVLVTITNKSPFEFSDLWYVADQGTQMSNFDGLVNDRRAFKIDADNCDTVGNNVPLISESITPDCIFEPNEIWEFIIDGYIQSASLSASNFGTIGVPSPPSSVPSSGEEDDGSTGNIIAISQDGGGGAIGGIVSPIDTTALMLYYIQGTAAWMIPVIVAAVGIGIVLARKF